MVYRSRKKFRSKPRSRILRSTIRADIDEAQSKVASKLLSEAQALLKKYPYRTIVLGIILLATGALTAKNMTSVQKLIERGKDFVDPAGAKRDGFSDRVKGFFGGGRPEPAPPETVYAADPSIHSQTLGQRSRRINRVLAEARNIARIL